MTTSKDLFCANKELREWWVSVVANPHFDSVMLYARAESLEQIPSEEQRRGALHFGQILATLHQPASAEDHFPRPGLNHKLDEPRNTKPTKTK